MTQNLDAKVLAELEIAWWASYHTRNFPQLEKDIKALRKAQFGVEISTESAGHFVRAGGAYIEYKKALLEKNESEAERYLALAEEHMKKHYEDIVEKLKNESN